MNCARNITPLALSAMVIVCAGCQNTVNVRVERIMVESEHYLRHNSILGRELDRSISHLNDLLTALDARALVEVPIGPTTTGSTTRASTDSTIRFLKQKFSTSTSNDAFTACATFIKTDRSNLISQAKNLVAKCQSYFAPNLDITKKTEEVWDTLRKVTSFFKKSKREMRYLISTLKEQQCPEVAKAIRRIGEASEIRTLGVATEFGGFVHTDVYVINPSDPKYKEVLKPRKVSDKALTEVTVGVTGDSSIMIVFEHPGQVRVYQVSMNPTQITSNIALLMAKGSAAAAKFMNAGLAP